MLFNFPYHIISQKIFSFKLHTVLPVRLVQVYVFSEETGLFWWRAKERHMGIPDLRIWQPARWLAPAVTTEVVNEQRWIKGSFKWLILWFKRFKHCRIKNVFSGILITNIFYLSIRRRISVRFKEVLQLTVGSNRVTDGLLVVNNSFDCNIYHETYHILIFYH